MLWALQEKARRYNAIVGDRARRAQRDRELTRQFRTLEESMRLMRMRNDLEILTLIPHFNELQINSTHNVLFKAGLIYLKGVVLQAGSYLEEAVEVFRSLVTVLFECGL